jgi:hypothetical protein
VRSPSFSVNAASIVTPTVNSEPISLRKKRIVVLKIVSDSYVPTIVKPTLQQRENEVI